MPQKVFITLILIIVIIGLIRVWLKILKMIYIYLNMLKGDIIDYWVKDNRIARVHVSRCMGHVSEK